jgi:hypothetical protein
MTPGPSRGSSRRTPVLERLLADAPLSLPEKADACDELLRLLVDGPATSHELMAHLAFTVAPGRPSLALEWSGVERFLRELAAVSLVDSSWAFHVERGFEEHYRLTVLGRKRVGVTRTFADAMWLWWTGLWFQRAMARSLAWPLSERAEPRRSRAETAIRGSYESITEETMSDRELGIEVHRARNAMYVRRLDLAFPGIERCDPKDAREIAHALGVIAAYLDQMDPTDTGEPRVAAFIRQLSGTLLAADLSEPFGAAEVGVVFVQWVRRAALESDLDSETQRRVEAGVTAFAAQLGTRPETLLDVTPVDRCEAGLCSHAPPCDMQAEVE